MCYFLSLPCTRDAAPSFNHLHCFSSSSNCQRLQQWSGRGTLAVNLSWGAGNFHTQETKLKPPASHHWLPLNVKCNWECQMIELCGPAGQEAVVQVSCHGAPILDATPPTPPKKEKKNLLLTNYLIVIVKCQVLSQSHLDQTDKCQEPTASGNTSHRRWGGNET